MTATRLDRRWTRHLPLAFVVIALVALVTLPVVAERFTAPLIRDVRDVVEPARQLVTQIHVALAIEGSTFHDYLQAGDSTLLRRYEQEYARELRAYLQLERLVGRLGAPVQARYVEVRVLERAWHDMVDTILRDRMLNRTGAVRRAAAREQDAFERLLLAAAGLDDALGRAAQDRRARINAADRIRRRFTVVVGLVALAAAGGVAWLARRVQQYARESEERRVQLERATESRARLMRGVSHDLKNPLGTIDGHAALLVDGVKGPLNPGQQESLTRIRRSVHALLALITDLLELSKAESGHLSVKPRPTNVTEVVRDVADEHRDVVTAAGHQLRTEISEDIPAVHTDPDRVRQVLGNLLSNAVKYTPSGGHIVVRAELRSSNRSSRGRFAAIDVEDSGPGIAGTKLEEVFDEFARLDAGAAPGTGLGLTIARRISHLLGGDITVASELGRGATFTLWLPLEPRARDDRATT